jgi:hypothetical protein
MQASAQTPGAHFSCKTPDSSRIERGGPALHTASVGEQLKYGLRDRRVTLNIDAHLVDCTGERVKVTVLDLSQGGVRLQVVEPLFVGETIELELGRSGYAKVVVCWTQGNEAGGTFLEMR